MTNTTIKTILSFMQREDRNGTWLEWYDEIERNESEFNASEVIEVLESWYEDSKEEKYNNMINFIQSN